MGVFSFQRVASSYRRPSERSEAANGDGDRAGHAGHDSRVEKDPPAAHRADVDQRGPVITSPAPTEPQVTNVTSASTAGVAVGNDERIPAGVLVEPLACPIVENDGEFVHLKIMPVGISEPLYLDPSRSGIVDNRGRLESGT